MTGWEYLRFRVTDSEDANLERLNKLGREGWELVHVDHVFTLKRPRVPPLPQPKANNQGWTRVRCSECLDTTDPECLICRGYGYLVKRP